MENSSSSSKKKKLVAVAAVVLAAALLVSGTFAYLSATSDEVENVFATNYVDVDLKEDGDRQYSIVPGTSEEKDPIVYLDATLDTYVFITVKDSVGEYVDYSVLEDWTLIDTIENADGSVSYVYYQLVSASDETTELRILENGTVSYSSELENSDMLVYNDETGLYELKDGIELSFSAYAIQAEPFESVYMAYYGVSVKFENTSVNQDTNPYCLVGLSKEAVGTSVLYQAGFEYDNYNHSSGRNFIIPSSKYWSDISYTFTIAGTPSQDMALTLDFDEQCDAGETYKDIYFPYGFGGYEDMYLAAGNYSYGSTAFTLVGDYYPIVVTIEQTKSTAIESSVYQTTYSGTLASIIEQIANTYTLKSGTTYNEEFKITMSWPFETAATDDCYVLIGTEKQATMDLADDVIGYYGGTDYSETWADFEVTLVPAS